MPRPIWKGAISFGLVTIPVALYPATESRRPSFRQLRREDNSRIRYRRVAESDGAEVPLDDIVKGFEVEKDRYVVFTDEEIEAALKARRGGMVEVAQFVDAGQIDPVYYRQSYYLAPEKAGVKAYRIFLRALEESGVVGLARVALREREYPATLRPAEGVLLLETMYWPDEIREPAFETLEEQVKVRPEELKLARTIIDNLTAPFEPSAWVDESREAVEDLAKRKVAGEEVVATETQPVAGVIDLMEALRASVEATEKRTATRKKRAAAG